MVLTSLGSANTIRSFFLTSRLVKQRQR